MSTDEKRDAAGQTGELDSSAEQQFFAEPAEEDPELMQLPNPRRRRRHPLISVAVIALSLYLMWFVRDDFLYFLQPRRPVDVGEAERALAEGKLRHNTHVSLSGSPDRKHAVVLQARFAGYESFFRMLQTSNRVFVQQHRENRASAETFAGTFSGQLIRFDALPYRKGLSAFFGKTMTTSHELSFADVARAQRGAPALVDRAGATFEVSRDTLFWINVAYPDEYLIQISKRFYPRLEDTKRVLKVVEIPVAVDEEPSATFWRFVVQASPDQVKSLLGRLKDPELHADLVRRQVSYSARWNQLRVDGKNLVLDVADPTMPVQYQLNKERVLSPVRETPTRIPGAAVLFISTSSPFHIPPDAFVLISGRTPSENWYYALLFFVLLTFIIINAVALSQHLRPRATPRS